MCCHYGNLYIRRCTNVLSLKAPVLSAGVQICCNYENLYYPQVSKCVVTTGICIICRCADVL